MLEPMTREEAELLFRKLENDGVAVLCFSELFGWRVTVRGTVKLDGAEVILTGLGGAEVVLRLDVEDTLFWYAEPGKVSLPEPISEMAQDSSCVCVAMPLRVLPKDIRSFEESLPGALWFREKLLFLELRDER